MHHDGGPLRRAVSVAAAIACVLVLGGCRTSLWGDNTSGAIGDGTTDSATTPRLLDGADWISVTAGGDPGVGFIDDTCAVRADHTAWCWGNNDQGQLGDGTTMTRLAPTQVGADADWFRLSAGGLRTCGLRLDHTMWCWGANGGLLGDGGFDAHLVPTQIGTAADWATVDVGKQHSCGIRTDGSLWCWGADDDGQLGVDETLLDPGHRALAPLEVDSGHWDRVAVGSFHTCAVRGDHTLWCWGDNSDGELGTGSEPEHRVPEQVGSASDWTTVSAGVEHTCAVRLDGTLWCWGFNQQGEVGDGTTVTRFVPTQVGGADGWTKVAAGDIHTCALRSDHSLWCWGDNSVAQLGKGLPDNEAAPTQIGAGTMWLNIESGPQHTAAIHA